MLLRAVVVFDGEVFCGEEGIWGLGLVVMKWQRQWWWALGVATFVLEDGI